MLRKRFLYLLFLLTIPNVVFAQWMPSTAVMLGGIVFTILLFWLLWYIVWFFIKKIGKANKKATEVHETINHESQIIEPQTIGFGLNNLRRLHLVFSFMLVLYLFFTLAEVFPAPSPWDRIPWYKGSLVMFAFWLRILMYVIVSLGLVLTARGLQFKSFKWGYQGGLILSAICLFNVLIIFFAYKGGVNWFFLIYGILLFLLMKKHKSEFN